MQAELDERAIQTLEANRIYFHVGGRRRLKAGDVVHFSEHSLLEPYVAITAGDSIPTMGSFSYTSSDLPSDIRIGRYCSIARGLSIIGTNHPTEFLSSAPFTYNQRDYVIFAQCLADSGVQDFSRLYKIPKSRPNRKEMPVIGDDVWVGEDVMLARGITLGTGCIIGAGAVVTKSVAPYCIVGGNPARPIRMRFPEHLVDRLLRSQWWRYKFSDFARLRYDNVALFLDGLAQGVEGGEIRPFDPPRFRVHDLFNTGDRDLTQATSPDD